MALDFFAGCVGGAAGVFAGHPLDTVKVRLQTQEAGKKLYKGTFHCWSTIVKQEGVFKGLYKGITPPLASLTVINATVFGVHGMVSKKFENPDSIQAHFFAGCAAGLAQSIIATPSERIKLLIQIQNDAAHTRYKSPIHAAKSLIQREGYGCLSRGFLATVLRDCPAFGIYFASYDWMARKMSKDGKMESLTTPQLLFAGGGAGMLSWLFNYPTDVIKTRFQTCNSYKSYWDVILKTYAENGWRSFFVGLNSTLLRAFPSNAATFFTVEWTYRLLIDNNILGSSTEGHSHKHNSKKQHVMMPDLWHKNWFILPEAGSTSIDPMIHGCRFI
ncbi:slc-25A29 [Pristionchus pacificus]|uniref:Mitochondrial basic amino acids transporter n=1 Tax=Pristionchus pacificus TaxID=54126 RepID=A0A2A6CSR9_PRIPA|nr:slc-25A29 [Pristionchus pacificus]|eukprot:PDM81160.1 mitochondrial carrier protein [Pristionchus pacificus]